MTEIGKVRVPNEGPESARLYLVGEAPGADEVAELRPFIGVSGTLLRDALARSGVSDSSVRLANLCQFRPPDNKFPTVLGSRQLASSLEELTADIQQFHPTCIAALGNWPLWYLTGRRGKKGPGTGIGKWRGSILPCTLSGCESIKVVPTYHPAFIVRQREMYPVFDTDIKRAIHDSTFPEFNYPQRKMVLDPQGIDLDYWTDVLCQSDTLACDIESIKNSSHILCHGFSPNPNLSVVIPHSDTDFKTLDALNRIYQSNSRKIFHNGSGFDLLMLSLNGFKVKNYWWDTMIAQHVMWAELPKSLDYLTSVHTRQIYYKTAGRAEIPEDGKSWDRKFDKKALWEYNATDTSVTSEIELCQVQEMAEGPPEWTKKFEHMMRLTKPAISISLAGLTIDLKRREQIGKVLRIKWALNQYLLNNLTGFKTNVNSTKWMPRILYDKDKLGLPVRRNRAGGLTTDEDAIVSLISYCKDYISRLKPGGAAVQYWTVRYECLKTILLIRGIRKLLSSYINVNISEDGKYRATYKVTGTETLRWSAAKFVDGTGGNAQTFPRDPIEIKNYEEIPELAAVMAIIREQEGEDDIDNDGEDAAEEYGDSGEGSSPSQL